jgi:ATP-dependent Clp protease adaptor protein ClpS
MGCCPFYQVVNTGKPQIEKESEVDVLSQEAREHQIILYNDDVNTFGHVINTLVAYCDHTFEQAEQCAYIVHHSGKCVVKTGSYEVLEPICIKLLEAQLSAEIL